MSRQQHSPFGEFRNPLLDDDDDDWTEAHDADIPRVDLVGMAANGSRGFLIMKSGEQAGLIDASGVRRLIAKKTPQKEEQTMHTYMRNGRKIVSARRLTGSELREQVRKASAGTGTLVAVYDASGVLIGTCDQSKIIPIGNPVDPNAPKAPKAAAPAPAPAAETVAAGATRRIAEAKTKAKAPVAPEDATDGPAERVAKTLELFTPMVRDLNETLAPIHFPGDSSSFARGSVEERWGKLRKVVGTRAAGQLDDAVARGATSTIFGQGYPSGLAVHLAKRMALDAATFHADQVREAPEAVLKRVHRRGPTV